MTEDQFKPLAGIILDVHKKFMENVATRIGRATYPELLSLNGRARGATDIVKQIIDALKEATQEGKI